MSKLPNYTGTIKLISGLTQANGQDFPILEAHSIVVDEDGTRLDSIVSDVHNKMDKFGNMTYVGSGYPVLTSLESALTIQTAGNHPAKIEMLGSGGTFIFSGSSGYIAFVPSEISNKLTISGVPIPESDSEVSNKLYVDSRISALASNMTSGLKRIIVDELPTNNVDESAIYMLGTATDSLLGSEANLANYEGSPIHGATYYPNGDTFIYDENSIQVDCYSFIESNTGAEIKIAKPDVLSDDNVVVNYAIVSSIDTDNSPTTVSLDFYGYKKIDNVYIEYMYINSRWEVIGNTSTEGGGSTNTIITNLQNTVSKQQATIDGLVQRLSELESIAATVYSLPK